MKRNTAILFLLVALSAISLKAKSQTASEEEELMKSKRVFNEEVISNLKKTKTVFFYKKDKKKQFDSLKAVLSSVWDLTPLLFDDIDNIEKYVGDSKYSYFALEASIFNYEGSIRSYTNKRYYLGLRTFKGLGKKDKVITDGLGRIELFTSYQSIYDGDQIKRAQLIDFLYNDAVFYNWSPILIGAEVGNICTNLKKNIRAQLHVSFHAENLKETLPNDTLYILASNLISPTSGKSRDFVFQKFYKHPYKVCTDKELYDIFQNQKRGRFLYEFVSSDSKFITIFDYKEKAIVYKHCVGFSDVLTEQDISKIEKTLQ